MSRRVVLQKLLLGDAYEMPRSRAELKGEYERGHVPGIARVISIMRCQMHCESLMHACRGVSWTLLAIGFCNSNSATLRERPDPLMNALPQQQQPAQPSIF